MSKVTNINKRQEDAFKELGRYVDNHSDEWISCILVTAGQNGSIDMTLAGTASLSEIVAMLEIAKYQILGSMLKDDDLEETT